MIPCLTTADSQQHSSPKTTVCWSSLVKNRLNLFSI